MQDRCGSAACVAANTAPQRRRSAATSDTGRRSRARCAFQASDVAAGRRIDATGTRRRLQALVTLGWSASLRATIKNLAMLTLTTTTVLLVAKATTRGLPHLPLPTYAVRRTAAGAYGA